MEIGLLGGDGFGWRGVMIVAIARASGELLLTGRAGEFFIGIVCRIEEGRGGVNVGVDFAAVRGFRNQEPDLRGACQLYRVNWIEKVGHTNGEMTAPAMATQ